MTCVYWPELIKLIEKYQFQILIETLLFTKVLGTELRVWANTMFKL